MIKRNL